ncbi:MAG: hypothetical protein WA919_13440 [Coleofasciculaceae cyanobacterium]
MISSRNSLLAIGLSVAILGSILGKLAIDNRLPWQTARTSSNIAEAQETGQSSEDNEVDAT